MIRKFALPLLTALLLSHFATSSQASLPVAAVLDEKVHQAMAATGVKGIAIALIDRGKVETIRTYGSRNAEGAPLDPNTVMYAASLTKAVFAYTVMQLVDEHALTLDQPIADLLPKPLPDYGPRTRNAPWSDLAGDERWRKITPRIVLTHSTGFANFAFMEDDGKLRIHFAPGTRYAYSGQGLMLLQFALEEGRGIDVGDEMQRRVFDRLGMPRTSMIWRNDFSADAADGWDEKGGIVAHDRRARVQAAGSMDTTIADFAQFAAAFVRGTGLSVRSRREMVRPQLPIRSPSQFPTFQPDAAHSEQRTDLSAGLGMITFKGPQGAGFYKGGHDDSTANTWVCIERSQRCIVILSNDVRAEAVFPELVRFALGETGMPWNWEYGSMKFWNAR